MPSFRAPYEPPVEVSYVATPQGPKRVRSARVKPYRLHELRLLAEGVAIVYCGQSRSDAGGEAPEQTEQQKLAAMSIRPIWKSNPASANPAKYESKYVGKFTDIA